MTEQMIEKSFKDKVSSKVKLLSEGLDKFRVFTPFVFEDGDHFAITLQKHNSNWRFSDEGHTYMHLTYDIAEKDLHSDTRQKIINNALSMYNIEDNDGELMLQANDDQLGDALFSFVQVLMKISDVSYLSRERVKSTFVEDFRSLLTEIVPEDRREFDWCDTEYDKKRVYEVDCRINGMPKPLFVFALSNNDKTQVATIAMHQFEKWGLQYHSIGIFEDQETINRKVLARYSDVAEKQFSNLTGNSDRIVKYVKNLIK